MFDPVSTYRLQFHAGFNFSDFERIIPYLQRLGVQTIYASPVFKAVPGSTHGYDGLHPHEINPEIGSLEQLRRLHVQLQERGIRWLQDIVPNHMAFHPGNEWLMDILEKGNRSVYASFFDIGWNNAATNRLMVPFLGASLDDAIKNGEVKTAYHKGRLVFDYYGNIYPLNARSYILLLHDAEAPAVITDLLKQVDGIDQIEDLQMYAAAWENCRHQLESSMQQPELTQWADACLNRVNSDPSLLQQLAGEQYYSLCFWQDTDKLINYRRFFTVNGLICLNVQDQQVFDRYHSLIKTLVDEQVFHGLRVDHIDGLYNPHEYLQRLRTIAGNEKYVVVEKILAPDERLPGLWPVQGTTGYEFLATVNNLLTLKKNEQAFKDYYAGLIPDAATVTEQVLQKKAYILYEHMGGELENLYQLFGELYLVEADSLQSLAPGSLKKAIGEFLVRCPVYRYYGENLPLDAEETAHVESVLNGIKQVEPELREAVGLLEFAWLKKPHEGNEEYNRRAAHFYKRCMQFSGPLMAKGVEDTLMYTYNRFVAHNEVGDAPDAFGYDAETFHQKMKDRQKHWPLSLNATSSHDTKRGEDVRARLNVLSDVPQQWFGYVEKWRQLNATLKQHEAPDVNDEYFIYQTLIGTYPMPGDNDPSYPERLQEYLQKALREAKVHSYWTTPDEAYESATKKFAVTLLDKQKPFWKSFERFHRQIADFGIVNSLVQVILKFTCPGVPDNYQGCELWDLSFVDPDNRRAISFDKNENFLDSVLQKKNQNLLARGLWRNRVDGRVKLWLVHTLLELRKQQPALFSEGEYIPLTVEGAYKENILAFARNEGLNWLVVAVPLHMAALCEEQNSTLEKINWKDTQIVVPRDMQGPWKNSLLNYKGVATEKLAVGEIFKVLPFAILNIQGSANVRGAGILLHITSLPSRFGIGDLGPEAYRFADALKRNGQKYWQVLPVNPVEAGQAYSPYSAVSSRAGNTWIISPELLAKDGLLPENELRSHCLPNDNVVDYAGAENVRNELLERAWKNFNEKKDSGLHKKFVDFCEKEKLWLDDFALYTMLKQENEGKPWYDWEEKCKKRSLETVKAFIIQHKNKIEKEKWLQFVFDRQWHQLKNYLNKYDIKLIGDLPFYVSYDSADVWAHQEIFSLDAEGARIGVAGVPPDAFSDDGQLWGMPVFNWKVLKESGYKWWVERLRKNKEMFDLIRLDHFRAFSGYWEVPAGEQTARTGGWKPGPGAEFFNAIIRELGALPFLAEDLGEIDAPVHKLREMFRFPGMKILQFAFGDDFPRSDYLPHNYHPNFFVYTGTHDNNTVVGWYRKEASDETRLHLARYAGKELTEDNVHTTMAQLAYASVARTVILPMQDVLGLDETARMNIPSSANGNWKWRLLPDQLSEDALAQLYEWVSVYDRGQ